MSQSQLECTLNPKIFQESIHKLGVNPTIDLFESRINFQLQPCVSYHPDPGAVAINAFHMSWKCNFFSASENSTGKINRSPCGSQVAPHRFDGQS